MIKNFIFDVDRTLLDSYKTELETLKKALYTVTKTNYNDEVINKLTQLTTDEFFEGIGIKKDSDTLKQINNHWEKFLKERKILLFDGIKELLIHLKNNNCFIAIVTSRTKDELNELDELIKYINLFDVVITSDMVTNPKPDPESINLIIDKFNLKKEETIYIGDTQNDATASAKASIYFGFANWENKNSISKYDYLFEKVEDIKNILIYEY